MLSVNIYQIGCSKQCVFVFVLEWRLEERNVYIIVGDSWLDDVLVESPAQPRN
jgi:hypothetical protein